MGDLGFGLGGVVGFGLDCGFTRGFLWLLLGFRCWVCRFGFGCFIVASIGFAPFGVLFGWVSWVRALDINLLCCFYVVASFGLGLLWLYFWFVLYYGFRCMLVYCI